MSQPDAVFLGCFKDMGSQSVVQAPTLEALKHKFPAYMLIEGKGGLRFLESHFFPGATQITVPSESPLLFNARIHGNVLSVIAGSDDFSLRPFDFDCEWFLRELFGCSGMKERPGVVLIGESSPINLERKIALALPKINMMRRTTRIKLVVCQDFWGSSRVVAPDIHPHMVQVNDLYAAELTLETYPYLFEKDIIIRGNPGVKKVAISPEVASMHEDLRKRFETIYFFAGGGEPATSQELAILKGCLLRSPGDFCLVVGFHPKLVEGHGALWRSIVETLGERVVEAKPGTGDEWASLADMTISGHSTTMTTALYAGKRALSINTEATAEYYKKKGMGGVPQVTLGWVESIEIPHNLSQFGRPSQEALKSLVPFDAQEAFESIAEQIEYS